MPEVQVADYACPVFSVHTYRKNSWKQIYTLSSDQDSLWQINISKVSSIRLSVVFLWASSLFFRLVRGLRRGVYKTVLSINWHWVNSISTLQASCIEISNQVNMLSSHTLRACHRGWPYLCSRQSIVRLWLTQCSPRLWTDEPPYPANHCTESTPTGKSHLYLTLHQTPIIPVTFGWLFIAQWWWYFCFWSLSSANWRSAILVLQEALIWIPELKTQVLWLNTWLRDGIALPRSCSALRTIRLPLICESLKARCLASPTSLAELSMKFGGDSDFFFLCCLTSF